MKTRTININQLTEGIFTVKGKLSYSRLAKPIDGDELAEDQKRRRSKGRPIIDRPYTTATVYDAQLIYSDTPDMATYAREHFFTSLNNPQSVCFSATNKGNFKPRISKSLDGGHSSTEIILPKELAKDTEVILVVRIFKPKSGMNNGMTLDHVMVLGEPRYFENNRDEDLKRAGITFTPSADPVPTSNAEATAPAPAPAPMPVANAQQYSGNTAFAPTQTPFSSQVQPAQQNGFPSTGITFKPEN